MRRILHIDMDAFYASIEQRDSPSLRNRPVAVGGSERRGVLATASYEARRFGVRSAMPTARALRLCPDLVVVPPRFDVYRAVSLQVREIFYRYTDLVEPLSLDEAYLDVTEPKQGPLSGTLIASAIKDEIHRETGLTASAGVSFNKFLAKTASGMNKPAGLTVILPEEADAFIASLPVEKFFGIGAVTARKLKEMGITNGADLRGRSEEELVRRFGKLGRHFHRIARGEDDREVMPDRERKSVAAERTFLDDLTTPQEIDERLMAIADALATRLERNCVSGRTITLKIRYSDFEMTTRSRTLTSAICRLEDLLAVGRELMRTPEMPLRPIRLLGLAVSNLVVEGGEGEHEQMVLEFIAHS